MRIGPMTWDFMSLQLPGLTGVDALGSFESATSELAVTANSLGSRMLFGGRHRGGRPIFEDHLSLFKTRVYLSVGDCEFFGLFANSGTEGDATADCYRKRLRCVRNALTRFFEAERVDRFGHGAPFFGEGPARRASVEAFARRS